MKTKDIENFASEIKGKIIFNYSIKKLNWFNIGGKTKIFYIPDTLSELIEFLKVYNKRGKIFILGAGSNILFSDNLFDGVIIKLGKKFSNISKLNDETIIAGSSVLDKTLSEFATENQIGGLEFLSCIPGTVGGGIRMNSGCFKREFKDIILSIQALETSGKILTIPSEKIKFEYRKSCLPQDMIFLSASVYGKKNKKNIISDQVKNLKKQKELAQPLRVKTGGSTFKNPYGQTTKKVWQLIKESVPPNTKFGDAEISKIHSNFFINRENASFKDMKHLIKFVKSEVKKKTGVIIDTEVILVE